MPNETEVISCPACKHLVRVPADWLGQTVQCPECKATFTAPVREGDHLTDPVLLSGPPGATPAAAARSRPDTLLMLPAFGLMLLGFASVVVNSYYAVKYARDPAAAERDIVQILGAWRGAPQLGDKVEPGQKTNEEEAAELAPKVRVLVPLFVVVGALEFYGGLAMVRRRHYRMAQLGCVLASLNIPHLCCVPGAMVGLWGLLLLLSDEGREHFS